MATLSLAERFWSKVEIGDPDECWPWKRSTFHYGHGKFSLDGKGHQAHRVAYYLTNGEWPEPIGRHTCDNPPCCNPAHLIPGTHADNARDREERGRSARKVSDEQMADMQRRYAAGNITQRELGEEYGVTTRQASNLVRGMRRQASGSHV